MAVFMHMTLADTEEFENIFAALISSKKKAYINQDVGFLDHFIFVYWL